MKKAVLIVGGVAVLMAAAFGVYRATDNTGAQPETNAITFGADEPAAPPSTGSAVDSSEPATEIKPTNHSERIARSFRKLENSAGVPIGVSFSALDGTDPQSFGDLQNDVAWSTSKIPVAIAALYESGSINADTRSAITQSSNEAAESLWSSLGSARQAGRKVDAVFADSGDTSTQIQTRRVRKGFTPFGQTRWSLENQRDFAAWAACSDSATPVYELMGEISADQAWGIGSADSGAHFKGGWGPTSSGDGYLVRQFGVMENASNEQVAVAIITRTPTGDQTAGAEVLGRIAKWVKKNAIGSPRC